MATKKNFENIKTQRNTPAAGSRVFDAIEKGAAKRQQQGTASPEEARERAEAMNTQGRKGAKLDRMYLTITPSNMEFIRVMARATGQPMSKFINKVLTEYRLEHGEVYQQAQSFITALDADKEQ